MTYCNWFTAPPFLNVRTLQCGDKKDTLDAAHPTVFQHGAHWLALSNPRCGPLLIFPRRPLGPCVWRIRSKERIQFVQKHSQVHVLYTDVGSANMTKSGSLSHLHWIPPPLRPATSIWRRTVSGYRMLHGLDKKKNFQHSHSGGFPDAVK